MMLQDRSNTFTSISNCLCRVVQLSDRTVGNSAIRICKLADVRFIRASDFEAGEL